MLICAACRKSGPRITSGLLINRESAPPRLPNQARQHKDLNVVANLFRPEVRAGRGHLSPRCRESSRPSRRYVLATNRLNWGRYRYWPCLLRGTPAAKERVRSPVASTPSQRDRRGGRSGKLALL